MKLKDKSGRTWWLICSWHGNGNVQFEPSDETVLEMAKQICNDSDCAWPDNADDREVYLQPARAILLAMGSQ